jgi:hypothetical protein
MAQQKQKRVVKTKKKGLKNKKEKCIMCWYEDSAIVFSRKQLNFPKINGQIVECQNIKKRYLEILYCLTITQEQGNAEVRAENVRGHPRCRTALSDVGELPGVDVAHWFGGSRTRTHQVLPGI